MKKSNYKNIISIILMIIITGITQILTILKSSVVAGHFGTSADMDAYNFANSIVSFIFGFIASAISTIVTPEYVKKKNVKQTNSFITALYGSLALIIVLIMLLRYKIVSNFSNRDEMFVNVACEVLLILLLSNFLFAITNLTTAHYQCINKYNIPKIINLASQIIVVALLIFIQDLSIFQYAWIISAGIFLNFIIDIFIAIKCGWRFRVAFDFKNDATKKMFAMFFPMVLSTGVYKVSLLVDSIIASRLKEGMLTVLGYSNQIANIVNSILIGNLLIYCYPKIIKRISENDNKTVFWKQTSFFHLVVWFVIACFSTVGREGISLLFEHGKFDSTAVKSVYIGSLIYIIGQQSNIVRDLMYRYFYAVGDTKTTASNSILVSLTNIIVSIILVYCIGFYGIILGTVIASFVSLIRIFGQFSKKIGLGEPIMQILISFAQNIIIAVLSVIAVLFTKSIFHIESHILCIILYGLETGMLFMVLTVIIKKDIKSVIKSI